jgi:pimeloyl-ACP methyl ester carboxylesterase
MILQRKGHSIWWDSIGSPEKPPVLLIMGLALSARGWDKLPELLSKDFRVLVFDNRGTGKSSRRGFAFRIPDMADDAAAVLDAAGVADAHVFGISMGGMIAQELVLRHPSRVRSLALGCTFGSWRRAKTPAFRTKLDLLLLNMGFVTPARVGRLLVSAEWDAKNPGKVLEWIRAAEKTSLRFAVAQILAVGRHTTLKRLSQIKARTLILSGDADQLIPCANSQTLASAIPGARLQLLKGAGHAFPLEREEEAVQALTEHFSSAG